MIEHRKNRRTLKYLLRDERGIVAIYMTVCLPFFIGLLILCADGANLLWTRNLLQVTADSSALYAANQLPNLTAVQAAAQAYVGYNMPSQTYGSVLANSDVTLGYWPGSCNSKTSCLQSCSAPPSSTPCNAVQVTTRYTPHIYFASALKLTAFQESATAIATFGFGTGAPGSGSGSLPPTWDAVIAQDISESFKNSISNAQQADQALLTCMDQSSGSGSKLGLTLFTGDAPTNPKEAPALTNVINNYTTLKNDLNAYGDCGTGSNPACSGTDIAAGIIDGINQLTSASYLQSLTPGSQRNIIVVSDGQPNACGPTTHAKFPTICTATCDGNCNPSSAPSSAATAAANLAATDGINVSVIYYCSSGCNNTDQTFMQSLVRGKGSALIEPTASNLPADMQKICASQAARLVW